MKILVLHGPNLNLFGTREPDIYGRVTLDEIDVRLGALAQQRQIELRIARARKALTVCSSIPARSRITAMPSATRLRRSRCQRSKCTSQTSTSAKSFAIVPSRRPVCVGQVMGFGWRSYGLGLTGLIEHIGSITSR